MQELRAFLIPAIPVERVHNIRREHTGSRFIPRHVRLHILLAAVLSADQEPTRSSRGY
jgi:hypothetical protein